MPSIETLGKIADSEIAGKVYDDAASPAVRELGAMATDLLKTMRLFTAPFQLAALAQDRFSGWLDEARSRVPEDKQVEAPPTVAGPALRAMLFMESDNPMADLFVSLLSKAINKDYQAQVHPGFVTVLEQLSPDEALLLTKLQKHGMLGVQLVHVLEEKRFRLESETTFPKEEFGDPNSVYMYFEHLAALGLVQLREDVKIIPPEDRPEWKNYRWYGITTFGLRFLQICGQIPSDEAMDDAAARGSSSS